MEDRNQFGLIRLTFLNKTLFRPFSVETELLLVQVVTWATITCLIIMEIHFNRFNLFWARLKKLINQINQKRFFRSIHVERENVHLAQPTRNRRLIPIRHDLGVYSRNWNATVILLISRCIFMSHFKVYFFNLLYIPWEWRNLYERFVT